MRDPLDFAGIVMARRGGLALTLGGLGQLVEQEKEADSLVRINGQRAVSFNVFKQQDANIVAAGNAVKAALDELRKTLPPDVELSLIYANSDWVKQSLDGLKRTLVEGALLTVAIVFWFLHSWRSTVITGLTHCAGLPRRAFHLLSRLRDQPADLAGGPSPTAAGSCARPGRRCR